MADDSYVRGMNGMPDGTYAGAMGYDKFRQEQAALIASFAPPTPSSAPAASLDPGYASASAHYEGSPSRLVEWSDKAGLILSFVSTAVVAWLAFRFTGPYAYAAVDRYDFVSFTALHGQLIAAAAAGAFWASIAFKHGLIFNAGALALIWWFLS